jgi:hypothetical protein
LNLRASFSRAPSMSNAAVILLNGSSHIGHRSIHGCSVSMIFPPRAAAFERRGLGCFKARKEFMHPLMDAPLLSDNLLDIGEVAA